ncbi:MAG TPA: DUF4381 domain-containing protein, partial [Burkholderiales bacterium]|nr:DUF4381 domain-containing protein [Burkholderiales bacterium]
ALLAVAAWALWRWHRRREANRYRREALAELARLEDVAGIPPLLKRTALAAWPRKEVAALSGAQWVAFLRASGPLADLLDDAEYSGVPVPGEQAKAAAQRWIQEHRIGKPEETEK